MASKRRRINGFCALCRSRCGCISVVEKDRLVAVEPDPHHPTGRHLCAKGLAAPEIIHHPDRLKTPLRRRAPKGADDPAWEAIGWDEALETIADRIQGIAKRSGPEAVAFAVTTPSGTAMSDHIHWVERLIRAFGSPNTIYSTEICNWHKDHAPVFTYGKGIGAPDYDESGAILLWGHNPSTSWISSAHRVAKAKKRGAALIVVDPRKAGLANKADLWLPVRPGFDGALALGIAGEMIRQGWFDHQFLRDWTTGPFLVRGDTGRFLRNRDLGESHGDSHLLAWNETSASVTAYDPVRRRMLDPHASPALFGSYEVQTAGGSVTCRTAFDLLAELAQAWTPERAEAVTGVPVAQVTEAARLLFQRRPVSYYAWTGVGQHCDATQTSRALALLYSLTGSYDAPGGNVEFSKIPIHDVSGRDLITASQRAKALGLSERPLGPPRDGWITGKDFCRAVLEKQPYPVEALIAFGGNLLLSQPGTAKIEKALTQLPFFAQAELCLTPTSRYADIVLPVTTPWEHEGLRVGFDGDQEAFATLQLRPAAIPPTHDQRSDTWIVFELAKRLGLGDVFFDSDGERGLAHQLAPCGIELERLRQAPGGLRLPLECTYRKFARRQGDGHEGFATPSGRIEIYAEAFLEQGHDPLPVFRPPAHPSLTQSVPSDRYPLTLTSAKSPVFLHSQFRGVAALRRKEKDPRIEIHPESADARGIGEGTWALVTTPCGQFRARAKLNHSLAPDVVCAQHGWWQGCEALGLGGAPIRGPTTCNINSAIDDQDQDPISGSLPLRSYPCQVTAENPQSP